MRRRLTLTVLTLAVLAWAARREWARPLRDKPRWLDDYDRHGVAR